jgi:hypothetical protein
MKNTLSKIPTLLKRHKVLSIVALLVVLMTVWWGVNLIPKPLGDRMEYLGKEDYGNIFGFDSLPASIYYYGTDLSVEEIPAYFRKSVVVEEPRLSQGKNYLGIQTPSGETIYVYHYPSSKLKLFKTDKPYVVEIPSFKYEVALDSL